MNWVKVMSNKSKLIISLFILFLCFLISLTIGRYYLSISTILYLLKLKLLNLSIPVQYHSSYIVLWNVRLPRTLMSIIVGIALTLSGTVFQSLFKNPLVSPDILGVSSGASFGAALAILFFGTSALIIQCFTFCFGLLAVFFAYKISQKSKNESITTLVLGGIIISSLFSAGLSFLKYTADPYEELPSIIFWTMGGFNSSSWNELIKICPTILICLFLISLFRWKLNIVSLNDDDALSLGIDIIKARKFYIFFATLLAASCISSCGIISWVGLVVPHIARIIVGSNHSILIPFSATLGGIFMVIMDTIARSITSGEIPISIITSFIGAPFLMFLLIKQNKNQWDN